MTPAQRAKYANERITRILDSFRPPRSDSDGLNNYRVNRAIGLRSAVLQAAGAAADSVDQALTEICVLAREDVAFEDAALTHAIRQVYYYNRELLNMANPNAADRDPPLSDDACDAILESVNAWHRVNGKINRAAT